MGTVTAVNIVGESCYVANIDNLCTIKLCHTGKIIGSASTYQEARMQAEYEIMKEKTPTLYADTMIIPTEELTYEELIKPATERIMPKKLNKFAGICLDEEDSRVVEKVNASKIEEEVRTMLTDIGFTVKHYKDRTELDNPTTIYEQFPFKRMRLDFALHSAKVAIEVQGDYWHGKSNTLSPMQVKNKLRDDRKRRSLDKHGWTLLEIWESDIKSLRQTLYTDILNLMEL